jgi:hypothetical protein
MLMVDLAWIDREAARLLGIPAFVFANLCTYPVGRGVLASGFTASEIDHPPAFSCRRVSTGRVSVRVIAGSSRHIVMPFIPGNTDNVGIV